MPLTAADVRRLAHEARVGLGAAEAEDIARALEPLLRQLDAMLAVPVAGVDPVDGVGAAGMPLRADSGPPMQMDVTPDRFAPEWKDGLFVLPVSPSPRTARAGNAE